MRILLDIVAISPSMAGDSFVVVLQEHEGTRKLPIIIGAIEANAIAMYINNVRPERPLTHDLIQNVLLGLDVFVDHVYIREYSDGVFKSDLVLENSAANPKIIIDSRTSDAIAVAVRMECPIYVDDAILSECDESLINPTAAKPAAASLSDAQDPLILQKDLETALENEDYEAAARLRDLISGQQQ